MHISITQPYPDACTAAALTGPAGPCFYRLKDDIGCVSLALLVDEIAPMIKQIMGEAVAQTLALPLLWAALEPADNYKYILLPDKLKRKIVQAYTNAGGSTDLNPVEREEFYVLGDGSQLSLITIDSSDSNDQPESAVVSGHQGPHPVSRRSGGEGTRREFAALHSQLAAGRRYMAEVMSEVQRLRHETQREMQKVQAILRRVAMQPVIRRENTPVTVVSEPLANAASPPSRLQVSTARLSKRPKDLFELWHEFQFGCCGLKPAKNFTPIERGANKFAYSRRKAFGTLWRTSFD